MKPAAHNKVKAGQRLSSPRPTAFPLRLLPDRLAGLTVPCSTCGRSLKPDFFSVKTYPIVPIKPNDSPPDDAGRWVPLGQPLQCICGGAGDLEYPVHNARTRCMLYGDEAFREFESLAVCTYSLVGADHKLLDPVLEAVTNLKKRLAPMCDPASWAFHMKELWSGQHRKRHAVFANWDESVVRSAIDGLFAILSTQKGLFIYNISVAGSSAAIDVSKRRAYVALLMHVVDDITQHNCQPQLCFDSEKPGSGNQIIHGWARKLFHDIQYGVLYAFLARGIEIPEPRFVPPASHPCLELADFVSFVIARAHLDRWRDKQPLFDPSRLGVVRYSGFDRGDELVFTSQKGYPWELFQGRRI